MDRPSARSLLFLALPALLCIFARCEGCGVRFEPTIPQGGATEKFMVAVRNFAAELEREKISQRTHEHLLTKARKGLVAGGLVYGYDNVRRPEGGTVRAIC